MASCANGLKLAEEMGPRKRPLFWAILLSVVVSIVGSIWLVMKLSYESGGINLNQWFFVGGPVVPFNYITPILNTRRSPRRLWRASGRDAASPTT